MATDEHEGNTATHTRRSPCCVAEAERWMMVHGQPAPSEGLRDIERRFWKAESSWADKGSGMTEDQKIGAHMVFAWLRTAALARQETTDAP